jgi:flagellar L-ring protein precursor FlgH
MQSPQTQQPTRGTYGDMQPHRENRLKRTSRAAWAATFVCCAATWVGTAVAQDASLLTVPLPQQPSQMTLENSSFMFQKLPPQADRGELRVNDIITVLVDYRSSMLSEGDAENRKTANLNAVLSQWLAFDGKDLYNAPLRRGELAVNGSLDGKFRTESEMELRDTLTFRIAAKIVDIQPNGNLVIEAHRTIRINEEVWKQSLTGVVRRQAIGPDRTVRSDEVAELRIDKEEMGFIKDSYTRGWLTRAYDKWKPF